MWILLDNETQHVFHAVSRTLPVRLANAEVGTENDAFRRELEQTLIW